MRGFALLLNFTNAARTYKPHYPLCYHGYRHTDTTFANPSATSDFSLPLPTSDFLFLISDFSSENFAKGGKQDFCIFMQKTTIDETGQKITQNLFFFRHDRGII